MSIITRIKENRASFTETDEKIADYILVHLDTAVIMSAKQLADVSGTSPSAIIRFMKKLDYNNLNEVRFELSKTSVLLADDEAEQRDLIIREGDTLELIAEKSSSLIRETVSSTMELINFTALRIAADKIRSADTIYIYGIGASAGVAGDLHNKLLRINKRSVFVSDSHIQVVTAVNATPNDAVIAFSFSGSTKEVLTAVRKAHSLGAYCVGVTKAGTSKLSSMCDYVCAIPDIEGEIRLGAIGSRYGEFLISDIIFMYIASENLEQTKKYLIESRSLINELR